MPTPRSNEQVYIGGFNPVWECVVNGGVFIGSFAFSVMFATVVTDSKDIVLWASIIMGLTTLFRAWKWYDKWLDREWRLQQIDKEYVDQQSDDFVSPSQKIKRKQEIDQRGSNVWFSFVFFLIPYGAIIWFASWLLSAWANP